eukprot:6177313-Pleurochrysis_carterae.AAC.1
MCAMHKRGGAGEEYWEYSMTQARLISNVMRHRWGLREGNMTPHKRKTGRQPSVSHFRSMFCLAYARHHDALQGRKLEPRADKCIHLGTLPNKPNYRLEVPEGPQGGSHTSNLAH